MSNPKPNTYEVFEIKIDTGSRKDGTPTYSQELGIWGNERFPQMFSIDIKSPSEALPIGFYELDQKNFFEVQTSFNKTQLKVGNYPNWRENLIPLKKEIK